LKLEREFRKIFFKPMKVSAPVVLASMLNSMLMGFVLALMTEPRFS